MNSDQVVEYLVQNYIVSDVRAKQLCVLYKDIIDQGIKMDSFVGFVGDQIAEAAHLEFNDELEEQEEND